MSRERKGPAASAARRPGPRPSSSQAHEEPPHLQIASRTRLSPPASSPGSTEPASPLPTDDDASLAVSLSPRGSTSPVSLHNPPTPPPAPTPRFPHPTQPSALATTTVSRNSRARMTKPIVFPAFTDEPTPLSIRSWIGRCEDTMESFEAMNPSHNLTARNFITLAGLKLEQRAVSDWWEENRDELKKLSCFDDFTLKLREKFVRSTWRIEALSDFYDLRQGSLDAKQWVKAIERARGLLNAAGDEFKLADNIIVHHLLFYAHPILRRRILNTPTFKLSSQKIEGLSTLLEGTWDCLVGEGVIKPRHMAVASLPSGSSSAVSHSTNTLPTPPPLPTIAPLTTAERNALRDAGGCYNCRRKPGDPGWVQHRQHDCLGDPAAGIPPRATVRRVAAIMGRANNPESSDSEADYFSPGITTFPRHIAAVMASYPHDNVFDSDSSDDLSTRED
ncbi:Reverse transcriptase domain-containing protein [Mycena indigotica]|uniref:Reverse transcriptase domain-containing protein n=1 Tax=Mycena indigotica TaxID=2126181 RepID=A0A8H6W1G5_9AGAR|nr:Reverse transcriptase domain-containing protein [Mycena indigotica]KAF7299491.1 Reverse transcriptase domain-containing protein [Mycena indigotica]